MILETEVPFDFDFKYTPGESPTYDYPGSGPEVEITKVWLNGFEIPLSVVTSDMQDAMIELVLEEHD